MVYQVVDVKTARARGVAAPAEPDENKTNQFTRGDQDQVQDDLLAFQDIPLPLTRPKLSYFLLAVNLSVYTAGIVIALTISADSSNQFFLLLAKSNPEIVLGEYWRLLTVIVMHAGLLHLGHNCTALFFVGAEAVLVLGEYWRLLTAIFMHAGLLHLGLNCTALFFIGPEAEAVLGYRSFLALYLLSGLAGSTASLLSSDLVTVGASGALFGLLGALVAYFIRNPKLQWARLQVVYILGVVALNIALGTDRGSMIDNSGHIAGFLSGLWLGWFLCPQWKVTKVLRPAPGFATFEVAEDTSTSGAAATTSREPFPEAFERKPESGSGRAGEGVEPFPEPEASDRGSAKTDGRPEGSEGSRGPPSETRNSGVVGEGGSGAGDASKSDRPPEPFLEAETLDRRSAKMGSGQADAGASEGLGSEMQESRAERGGDGRAGEAKQSDWPPEPFLETETSDRRAFTTERGPVGTGGAERDNGGVGTGASTDTSMAREGLDATVAALERLVPTLEVQSAGVEADEGSTRSAERGVATGVPADEGGEARQKEARVKPASGVLEVTAEDVGNNLIRLTVVGSFVAGVGGFAYLGIMIRLAELWSEGMNAGM